MGDYRNFNLKFTNGGLDLVSPPDLQDEGRYTQLTNIRSKQEGVLAPRNGAELYVDYSDTDHPNGLVNFIQRINSGAKPFGRRHRHELPATVLVQRDGLLYFNSTVLTLGA